MAKQAPKDEKPFRPVDESLVRAVTLGKLEEKDSQGSKVELSRRRSEGGLNALKSLALKGPLDLNRKKKTSIGEEGERELRGNPEYEPWEIDVFGRPMNHAIKNRLPENAEKLTLEKRVLLSPSESRALERVASSLAGELGTSLKMSHVLRACTSLILNSEQEIIRAARESERLIRPPNGDIKALQKFERKLSKLLLKGFEESRGV